MSNIETKNIGLYTNGDTFCITVSNVHNVCDAIITGVTLTLTIPDGVSLHSYTIPKGSYDSVQNIWTVGSLTPNQLAEAEFCFIVTDSSKDSYYFEFEVDTPNACSNCFDTPIYCIDVSGISCYHLANKCGIGLSLIAETWTELTLSDDGRVTLFRDNLASVVFTGYTSGLSVNDTVTNSAGLFADGLVKLTRDFSQIHADISYQHSGGANSTTKILFLHCPGSSVTYDTDTTITFTVLRTDDATQITDNVLSNIEYSIPGTFQKGDFIGVAVYSDGVPVGDSLIAISTQIWGI